MEGLARVDVVCADKTGTLTEDRMMLRDVDVLEPALPVREALGALAGAEANPNASMRAIAADAAAPDGWMATETVPFSSARKWSGARFADQGWWVLGAPDMLLQADDPALIPANQQASEGLRVLLPRSRERHIERLLDGAPGTGSGVASRLGDAQPADTSRCRGDTRVLRASGRHGEDRQWRQPHNGRRCGSALGLPGASDTADARHLPDSPG